MEPTLRDWVYTDGEWIHVVRTNSNIYINGKEYIPAPKKEIGDWDE